jgi:hypothetical protein
MLAAAAGAILLVVAGYAAFWFFEASQVRASIARFIEARGAHGMAIHSESLTVTGFPFELEAAFGQLAIDGLPYARQARIESPVLVAHARPWMPGTWRFEAAKGFTLSVVLPDGSTITAAAGDARGRADGDAEKLVIRTDSHALTFQLGGATTAAAHLSLQLSLPTRPAEDHTTPSLSFAAVIDGAVLPGGFAPKDKLADELAIDGVVEGPVPEQPLRQALTAWRESGGTIELHRVALHWDAIELVGDGTVTLNGDLQPEAAFTGHIRGWDALLDGFVQAGTMTAIDAANARLGLGLLTRVAPDGKNELRAPITLQNGQVFLGPAKLAKLKPIPWQ